MLLLLQLRQPLSLVLNTDRLLKTKNCQQKRNEKNYIERPRYVSQKIISDIKIKENCQPSANNLLKQVQINEPSDLIE